MGRNSAWLAWVTLALGPAACGAQELPPAAAPPVPHIAPPAPPVARPLYPPPLPAVADPRTGAWRQVYVPPGACVEVGPAPPVGKRCPRCGDKLLHPFRGHFRGNLFGRHPEPGAGAPCQPDAHEGGATAADHGGAELLPPPPARGTPAAPRG